MLVFIIAVIWILLAMILVASIKKDIQKQYDERRKAIQTKEDNRTINVEFTIDGNLTEEQLRKAKKYIEEDLERYREDLESTINKVIASIKMADNTNNKQ